MNQVSGIRIHRYIDFAFYSNVICLMDKCGIHKHHPQCHTTPGFIALHKYALLALFQVNNITYHADFLDYSMMRFVSIVLGIVRCVSIVLGLMRCVSIVLGLIRCVSIVLGLVNNRKILKNAYTAKTLKLY